VGRKEELEFERSLGITHDDEEPGAAPGGFDEQAFEASLRQPEPQGGAGARLLEQLSGGDDERAAREKALQAEHGGALEQAMAGSEALSRGLTLGGSTVAGAALTGALTPDGPRLTPEARARMADPAVQARMAELGVRPQDVPADRSGFGIGYEAAQQQEEARAAANPTTAIAGELAGAVAPALLTGGGSAGASGGSLLARGGQAALRYSPAGLVERAGVNVAGRLAGPGAGIARTIGAQAAGGALDGGLGTLAYEASKTTAADIDNPEEAAEHLVYAVGTGMLLGGAAGGLLGGVPKALGRGGKQLDEFGTTLAQQAPEATPTTERAMLSLDDAERDLAPHIGREAAEHEVDNEAGLLLNEAQQQLEQRPLRSQDLVAPVRKPWQQVAEQANAAGGGFDTALEENTRLVREKLDTIQRARNHIREYAGIGQKKQANLFNEAPAVSPLEAQSGGTMFPKSQAVGQAINENIDQMRGEIAQFLKGRTKSSLRSGGGMGAIEGVLKEFDEGGAMINNYLAQGRIGDAYNVYDQSVKSAIQKAHGAKTPGVADLMERLHPMPKALLENDDVWGDFVTNGMSLSQRQKLANPAITNSISASQDARLAGLFSRSGEKQANKWDQIDLSRSSTIKSVLASAGDSGQDDVLEAYRTHLRAGAREAADVTRAWGGKQTRAQAAVIQDATKEVEDAIDRMTLLRRDKMAHEAAQKASTIQHVGAIFSALGANGIGMAISTGVAAKRKLVEMLGQATTPQARAAIQGAIPPPTPLEQTVNQVRGSTGSRIVGSAAALGRSIAGGASAASSAAPFVQGAMLSDDRHNQVVQQAVALNNPSSPEARQLYEQAAAIEKESPELANHFAMSKLKIADYITSRMPKPASSAFYADAKPQIDPTTNRKIKRSVAAAVDPVGAIERMSQMRGSPEDVETVRTLFPSMFKAYQANAKKALGAANKKPNLQTRVALSVQTSQPLDPSMELPALRMAQAYANGPDQQKLEEGKAEAKNMAEAATMSPQKPKFRDADDVYAPQADSIMSRR
jgi:hypothetical protein